MSAERDDTALLVVDVVMGVIVMLMAMLMVMMAVFVTVSRVMWVRMSLESVNCNW